MIIHIHECLSTQEEVKKFLTRKSVCIYTTKQLKGRGRKQNIWYTPEGSVAISIAFYQKRKHHLREISKFSCVCGYALVKFLKEKYKIQTFLKWPNDVYLNDKKLAGILCENYKNHLICGIGINLNTESFPASIKSLATSIKKEYKVKIKIKEFVNGLFTFLQKIFALFEEGFDFYDEILEVFYLKNKRVIVKSDKVYEGVVKGMDKNFNLLLKTKNFTYKIATGEVEVLK